jgi:uncharacterized membrane protein
MTGPPAHPFPGGYPPPVPRNGLGVASLVCGMFAAVSFWLPFVGVTLGITAVGIGLAARGRIKRGEADNNGPTITGIVLGTVVCVVGAVITLGFLYLVISHQSCIDHARGRADYARC